MEIRTSRFVGGMWKVKFQRFTFNEALAGIEAAACRQLRPGIVAGGGDWNEPGIRYYKTGSGKGN